MLKQQPAAVFQAGGCLVNDAADIFQAIGTAGQGRQWLMRQGGQMRVISADIGRVADDEIKRCLPLQRLQPAALGKLHRQIQALGIGLGVWVHLGYTLLGVGVLMRQSAWLFGAAKLAGAAYLIYLGWKMLRSPPGDLAATAARPASGLGRVIK